MTSAGLTPHTVVLDEPTAKYDVGQLVTHEYYDAGAPHKLIGRVDSIRRIGHDYYYDVLPEGFRTLKVTVKEEQLYLAEPPIVTKSESKPKIKNAQQNHS